MSLRASLGQGLFSDPIDKTITSFVVFIILAGLSPRLIALLPERRAARRPERRLTGRPGGTAQGATNLTGVPDFVRRTPVGFYRGLNPTTKMRNALSTAASLHAGGGSLPAASLTRG